MKKFSFFLMAIALLGSSLSFAQNSDNPWLLGIGAHATDYTSVAPLPMSDPFNTKDWSIVPPLSKLTVARSLNKSFSVDLEASIGEVDNKRFKIEDEFFILAGLGLRYKLANGYILKENSWFDPYLRAGANYHRFDYSSLNISKDNPTPTYDKDYTENGPVQVGDFKGQKDNFVINGGLGINFWITQNFGLNLETQYNVAANYSQRYASFYQHSASIVFRFGNTDKDKDGIKDKDDECPEVAGLAQFNGCPDTDGDGIKDSEDKCPTEAGPAENNGCPWTDADGDGITDNLDKCINEAGPIENNGCPWPDTDGDGILDKDDKCPTVKGLRQFQGCPDTDADGIADKDDKCPTVKGKADNGGCPYDEKIAASELNKVYFEFNKSVIKQESFKNIERGVELLNSDDMVANRYYIDGHTDLVGKDAYNKKLSQQRSQSVVNALVQKGVDKNRLVARGFGKSKPICNESTPECDAKNRRVEVIKIDPSQEPVKTATPTKKAPAKKKK